MARRGTNTEWMRQRLLAGVSDIPFGHETRDPSTIGRSRMNQEFLRGMEDRLMMGHFRYGWKADRGQKYNTPKALADRVQMYLDTGNTEYLMDVANFAMLEFEDPYHPNDHFHAGDDNHGNHAEEV